jgi:hypothetical protein
VSASVLLDVRESDPYQRGELPPVQIAHVNLDQASEAVTAVIAVLDVVAT